MSVKKAVHTIDWEAASDEDILNSRIKDLGLQVPGSILEPFVNRLYEELAARGIGFHPPCYLADEWLCPDKTPIIGIPFWLAHRRLKAIEHRMMFEVEGGADDVCMKLLRHECGHALNYAYELFKKTRWRELFGTFTANYSDSYYYKPYSRRYVIHLQDSYAQSHPDEDFAETFGVWLAPESRWQEKYRGWPAVNKLRYVDGLMKRIGGQAPKIVVRERPPWAASRMVSTLAAYYERRRRELGSSFLGYYDESLRALFATDGAGGSAKKASKVLRAHRRLIADYVAKWTSHRKYDIYQLINRLISRCDALGLRARSSEADNIIGMASLVTAIAGDELRFLRENHK
ncbi:MAG: putative zinc-binding metallopeptidase [Sedimentisphaerales bacterium]|nr:putative zinc-binding metallopeptidase [Sedimentisphaerales bacterium]